MILLAGSCDIAALLLWLFANLLLLAVQVLSGGATLSTSTRDAASLSVVAPAAYTSVAVQIDVATAAAEHFFFLKVRFLGEIV